MTKNTEMCSRTHTGKQLNLRRRILPVMIASCFGCGIAFANPVGPQVINGQVNFSNQGNLLSITNSPGSIINWQNFSIAPGEITRFNQQNSSSSVLNRIVGQDPSQILGALQSNGRVFIINPNGILFGQNAQVDVNGLVASTLNISNDDFLAGKLNFNAGTTAGDISNQGAITTPTGGQIYLIASNVENSGIITSPKGDVVLAAGHTVQLVDSGNPDVHVVVSAPESHALNLGQIIAEGGKIGIYGALINQRGIVSANSAVVGENGKIVFKASGDTILDAGSKTTATGAGTGGDIYLLGERVGLAGDAAVDASGHSGGGTVLVGGDYHGGNPLIQNAKQTYVSPGVQIKADALQSGDGGKVVVWSDDATRVYGGISARGGAQGGNGGFVEASGKQYLDYRAKVDVSAPMGKGGTLLLDPATITLVGGSGDGGSDASSTSFQGGATPGTVNFGDPDITTPSISNIFQSELEGLAPGTNIILEATDYISATGTFGNLVSLPLNSNLTMRTRNASSDGSGSIGINLIGSTDSSNLQFKTQGTGTITMQTGTGTSPQSADIQTGPLTTGGGSVSVNSSGAAVIRGITTTPSAPGNGGDISITTSSFITTDQLDARGNSGLAGNITLNSADSINIQTSKTIYGNQLKMTAVNGISDGGGGAISTEVSALNAHNTGSGVINVSNSGSNLSIMDIGGVGYGVKQDLAGQSISIASATGETIDVNAPVKTNGGAISLDGAGGINVNASNNILSAGGAVTLSTVDSDALISIGAGSTINSGNGTVSLTADNMDLSGTINAGTGNVALSPTTLSAAVNLGAGQADATGVLGLTDTELKGITTSGTLTIGNPALTGVLSVAGALDLQTGAGLTGKLLLSGASNIFIGAPLNAPSTLVFSTGGVISQSSTAPISATELKAVGEAVSLDQSANPVGVIAGNATDGNFAFRTSNLLTVTTVDGHAGISGGTVSLVSDSTSGVNQSASGTIFGGGLAITSAGPVDLTTAPNNVGAVAANLPTGGGFSMTNMSDLDVTTVQSITGITTVNQPVSLKVTNSGLLTVSEKIDAGSANVLLQSDALNIGTSLGDKVVGGFVGITNDTGVKGITVGGAGSGLSIQNLYQVNAPVIVIGSSTTNASGAIDVAGVTVGGSAVTDRNANTNLIVLRTGAGVTQSGSIDVLELGVDASGAVDLSTSSNNVTNLAGKAGTGNFAFNSAAALNVAALTGTGVSMTGIQTPAGNIALTAVTGDLTVGSLIDAGAGNVDLTATAGALTGGIVKGGIFHASASNGMTLSTQVSTLYAMNSGSNDINITNIGPLTVQNSSQSAGAGNITINNTGAVTVAGTVSAVAGTGAISIIAHSPLTVASGGTVQTSSGAINLTAGNSGSTADKLIVASGGTVTSTSGVITLTAGDTIDTSAGTVSLGAHLVPNQNPVPPPPPPPPPTLTSCISNPALTGCDKVLPTLSACTTTPTLSGCQVVLPTVSTCSATPSLPGCIAVLPSISACTTTPTLAGCQAVLPSVSTCSTDPSIQGCIAVLPSISTCTTTPTLAGCQAVLPSVAACTASPSLPGCVAVLPSISACVTTPTLAGCQAVLPTFSTCTVTPSLPGCVAVLPSISACVTTPTLAGCQAVLPSLSACVTTPTLAGCQAVLPTVSACIASPSLPGCAAVLPSISTCVTTPSLAGCQAVLPTISACSAAPSLPGCAAVLPSLGTCVASPTLLGCSAVLPTTSQCATSPTLAGCESVLPVVSGNDNSQPVTQALNTTINIINTVTQTPTTVVSTGNGISSTSAGDGKSSNTKDDVKKDDKNDTVLAKDTGAKKDEPVKKMYCN